MLPPRPYIFLSAGESFMTHVTNELLLVKQHAARTIQESNVPKRQVKAGQA